jgi:hypothetical protein
MNELSVIQKTYDFVSAFFLGINQGKDIAYWFVGSDRVACRKAIALLTASL